MGFHQQHGTEVPLLFNIPDDNFLLTSDDLRSFVIIFVVFLGGTTFFRFMARA